MKYYTALTIAGSDSCGGAGIQADIKTMSALGVYAASAITAITVQNTKGVYGIQNVEPEIVKGQIEAVMDDIQPDAIKIGMVNDRDTIKAIANTLKKYQGKYQHLVIDPVMVSTSGCRLMQEDPDRCHRNSPSSDYSAGGYRRSAHPYSLPDALSRRHSSSGGLP